MNEKFEKFVEYFKSGSNYVSKVSESGGKVKVQTAIGSTQAVISYDGFMVSIVHYIAPIRETSDLLYNKINELDRKFMSTAKIGLNVENFNGQKYLITVFAYLGNGDPYDDADTMFEKYNRAYDIIENDIKDLFNYL